MIGNFRKKCLFLRLLWYDDKIKTMYISIYIYKYILFHHHYHQICFIWLNREILFQAVIIFHWVLEEVCFVSTNPWPLKLQVCITPFRFKFSDKPNCTSSRIYFSISITLNLLTLWSLYLATNQTALLRTLITKIQ